MRSSRRILALAISGLMTATLLGGCVVTPYPVGRHGGERDYRDDPDRGYHDGRDRDWHGRRGDGDHAGGTRTPD